MVVAVVQRSANNTGTFADLTGRRGLVWRCLSAHFHGRKGVWTDLRFLWVIGQRTLFYRAAELAVAPDAAHTCSLVHPRPLRRAGEPIRSADQPLVMMTEPDVALRLLGYVPQWVAYGFLSPDDLAQQCETYLQSSDSNTEHYRYAAFRRYLADRQALSATELSNYIELAHLDPNQTMAGAALAELLRWRGLSPEQVDYLATHRAYEAEFLQRLVARRRLLRAVAVGPISDALVEACVASKDAEVQRSLVASDSLTGEQLYRVVQDGCSRAVRNLALTTLRRRHHDPPN